MQRIEPPLIKDRYTDADFDVVGFHDCHMSGIKWSKDDFAITFTLDYIVGWVEPVGEDQHYRFWISPAELRFANVDDVDVLLQWSDLLMDCRIEGLNRLESRTTPNSTIQWHWELALAEPSGHIILWATGFELRILSDPILSDVQRLDANERRNTQTK